MTRRTLLTALAVCLVSVIAVGSQLLLSGDAQSGLTRLLGIYLEWRGAQRHEVEPGGGKALDYWQAGPAGAGPAPVILVHGAGGDAVTSWFRLLPPLADKRTVLAPQLHYADLVQSAGALDNFFWEQNAVIRLMDRQGLERASLVGLSAGAWVTALVAMNYPQRVESLVLISPMGMETEAVLGPLLDSENPGKAFVQRLFYSPPPLLDLFAGSLARPVDQAMQAMRRAMEPGEMQAMIQRMDLEGRLDLIRCPTLIVSGRDDRIIPHAVPRTMAEGIPGASLLVLDRCGHAVVWDRPSALEDAVVSFLDGREPSP